MDIESFIKDFRKNIIFVGKCLCIGVILGGICGVIGAMFHISVDYVTHLRLQTPWLIYLLPLGGICIVFLYRSVHLAYEPGTNTIIQSVRQQDKVPMLLAPAIFLATVITHLVGGSSGREGAALQIGGSIATTLGHLLHVNKKEMSILIMCGMSAVFSALFGTPITATLFAMEVVSVGIFYYAAFVPCLCSALMAKEVASFFHCQPTVFDFHQVLTLNISTFIQLVIFTLFIALFSIVFITMMHSSHHLFKTTFKNPYIRVVVGSMIIIVGVMLFGRDYLGAGMDVVNRAIFSQVNSYDFLLKALFTAVTIGCGFKGGEIVPTFFIGATLGYTVATVIGVDPHIGATLGIVGMFCCVVNSPLTSLVLGIEMFGSENIVAFTVVIAFCYVLSDYFSLYQAQKIVYSKTSPEYINQNAK